jgi:hypothetical protein
VVSAHREPSSAKPPVNETGPVQWPSPIRDRYWKDEDGTEWHPRSGGQCPPPKRLRQLMNSAETRVLLFYGPDGPTEVALADRDALQDRATPYLYGEPRRGDHTNFYAAEFRDGRRRSLLVIEQVC